MLIRIFTLALAVSAIGSIPASAQPFPGPFVPNPYAHSPYAPSPYAPSPYALIPYTPSPYAPSPYSPSPYAPSPFMPSPFTPAPYTPSPYSVSPYSPSPYTPGPFSPNPYSVAPNPYAFNPANNIMSTGVQYSLKVGKLSFSTFSNNISVLPATAPTTLPSYNVAAPAYSFAPSATASRSPAVLDLSGVDLDAVQR
jgi:hypothetical protein